MTIEEEREEDFERAFEELYVEIIHIADKKKELNEQLEAITKEIDTLQEKLKCKEMELKLSKA